MPPPINSNILYLGHIPFDWDEETVKSVVGGSGSIVDVRLGFDFAGKNKGYCFVEYQTPQQAQRAYNLLGQVIIKNENGYPRKLRVESSKEGFKSNTTPYEARQVLHIARTKLPENVKLPMEMLNSLPRSSPMPMNNSRMIPPQQQHVFQQASTSFQPQVPSAGLSTNNSMPAKLTQATKNLPFVSQLPFSTPDKIDLTLSKVNPTMLIEVISNMKNVLSAEPNKVYEFFQNPNLAPSAAQALLLMGFIDNEVLGETSNSANSTPQPQFRQTTPQQAFRQSTPQFQSPWPHLPVNTQMKLQQLNNMNMANSIAQLISMPDTQIAAMPAAQQQQVRMFKSQYL